MKKIIVLIAALGVVALAFVAGCEKQEAPKPAAEPAMAPASTPSSTATATASAPAK